ncbi:unnamed protein product [Lactuca virosa]|uniref:Uncharacterized protein n=1 Tax=Lactuca virosa TaxID=75947 RepID=A0AAU9NTC4_9ASTR|nr:unnamed protein product [Lactuca virosa]
MRDIGNSNRVLHCTIDPNVCYRQSKMSILNIENQLTSRSASQVVIYWWKAYHFSTFGIRCVSLRPPLLTGLFACMITKNTCFVCCKCKCRNDYDKKIDLKLERL